MAIIAESTETGKRYIILGSGYGMWRSEKGSAFVGDWGPDTKEGQKSLLCGCKENGEVVWLYADKMKVVSVDGKPPADFF